MKYKNHIPTLILSILSISYLSAQNTNAYLTMGTIMASSTLSVNAEIKLASFSSDRTMLYGKASGGFFQFFEFGDHPISNLHPFLALSGVALHGSKNKYLELGTGGQLFFNRGDRGKWLPYVSIGYRYQNEKKIFRAGFGIVDWLYVSFGRRF